MYAEAFRYPFEGDEWAKPFLIGCALVLAYGFIYLVATVLTFVFIGILLYPLLLIPLILLYGYAMSIFDTTIDGDQKTPPFEDWKEIAIQGVRMLGLLFVSQIPLAVLIAGYFVVAIGLSAGLSQVGTDAVAGQAFGGVTLLFLALFLGLSAAISYVLPASLCAAAADHSITSGFALRKLRPCLTGEYAIGWVLAFGLATLLGTIAGILSVLLVGIPLVFYTVVVASRLVAIGYREGIAEGTTSESEAVAHSVEDRAGDS
jgi:hypothetical protein